MDKSKPEKQDNSSKPKNAIPKRLFTDAGKIYAHTHPEFKGKFAELRITHKKDPDVIAAVEQFRVMCLEHKEAVLKWKLTFPEQAEKIDKQNNEQRLKKSIKKTASTKTVPLPENEKKGAGKGPEEAVPTGKISNLTELAELDESAEMSDLISAVEGSFVLQQTMHDAIKEMDVSLLELGESLCTQLESLTARMGDLHKKFDRCKTLYQGTLDKIDCIAEKLVGNKKGRFED